jgi:thiol-disulfide isomerase/thioredoxin
MRASSLLTALLLLACGADGGVAGPAPSAGAAQPAVEPEKVGYDLRRLRPAGDEPLVKTFERMHAQARAEGKQVAMLFSAEWCERCRRLELELGNLHPAGDIAHVRILELVEEDWEQALRMNEFELLRQRWDATKGTYPLFVVLDEHGGKVEEMKEAVDRLEQAGQAATVATWFRGLRRS